MIQTLLSAGLAIVMLAQGAALTPGVLRVAPDQRRAVGGVLIARLILLPVLALLLAWGFGLGPGWAVGLMLASLLPVSVAVLPLAGVLGAHAALSATLAAVTTLAAIVALPMLPVLAGGARLGEVLTSVLLLVALPFAIGLMLPAGLAPLRRALPILASLVGGLMILGALWVGLAQNGFNAALAAIVLAIAAFVLAGAVARAAGLAGPQATAVTLALVIPAAPVAIGLAAILGGSAWFGAMAMPSAVFAVAGYALAVMLIVLRLRRRA